MIFFSFSWYVSLVTFLNISLFVCLFFSASQIPLVLVQIYDVHALTFLVNKFRCLYLFTNTDSSQYSVSQCILLPHVRLLPDIYFIMDILHMRNFLNEFQTRYLFFLTLQKTLGSNFWFISCRVGLDCSVLFNTFKKILNYYESTLTNWPLFFFFFKF